MQELIAVDAAAIFDFLAGYGNVERRAGDRVGANLRAALAFAFYNSGVGEIAHGALHGAARAAKFLCDVFVAWQLVAGAIGAVENARMNAVSDVGPGMAQLLRQMSCPNC